MQAQWLTTVDLKEASAFATINATIKIIASLDERTSTRSVRFLMSPVSTDGKWRIPKIRKALRDKSLFRIEPGHPVITALRAMHNREAILDMQNKGKTFTLIPVANAPGVHQYVPGPDGLPGVGGAMAAVKTQDIKISGALALAGFPLLRITGSGNHHEYTHAALPQGAPASAGMDAATLVSDWRRDASAMSFALPFVQASTALLFREQLRTEVSKAIDTVLLHKPRSKSHAAIRADAPAPAWDSVSRFFNSSS